MVTNMYFLPSEKIRQDLQILISLNFPVKKHHFHIFDIKSTKHEDFKNIAHAPEGTNSSVKKSIKCVTNLTSVPIFCHLRQSHLLYCDKMWAHLSQI